MCALGVGGVRTGAGEESLMYVAGNLNHREDLCIVSGTRRGKRWMQSSSPRPDVINYLAIDPWASGILGRTSPSAFISARVCS